MFIVIPVRLIYGFFRGLFTGDWSVFQSSLRFWATCLGIMTLVALAASLVVAIVGTFNGLLSSQRGFVSTTPQPIIALQPTPTLSPTPAPTPIYSKSSVTDTPLPPLMANVTPIPHRNMYVCVPTANVRSGPGTNYSVTKQMINEWSVAVYGQTDEWYYIGYNEQGVDEFMHESVLCDQPPQAMSTSTPSRDWTVPDFQDAHRTPIAVRQIRVCRPYAPIRDGPYPDSQVMDYIHKDGVWLASAKVGDWYAGEASIAGRTLSGYVSVADLCDPDPAQTISCDDYIYNKWKNGKSDRYAPPCTPQW